MDAYTGYNPVTHSWGVLDNHNGEYRERVSYDANGNILTYNRNGTRVQPDMDKLQYGYNRDGSGNLVNNRLRHVKDVVADSNYPDDLDNQPDDNYEYDAIGNLIKDRKEGLVNVEWNVYGKIKSISKDTNGDGTVDEIITYTYDVAGNRISKTVGNETTYYIRDGSGNVMSVYTVSQCIACAGGGGNEPLKQKEVHLYGSSRLGILKRDVDMDSPADLRNYTSQRGNKRYEGTNHLGNTLVVFTDRKLNIDRNGDGIVDNYEVEIANANDYYPFGMGMPGRVYKSLGEGGYRYGFNGKEQDRDINSLTAYDYGFRIYNPAIGKFLSVDPLFKSYPWYTSYQFAGNKPIAAIDLDGLEEKIVTVQFFWDSKLNNSVVNKAPNPDRISGINTSDDKEVVAAALVLQAQRGNPNYDISANGQFVFWEFPEHPEKNSASYYVRVDGKLETFTVSPQILKQWNDELPKARANLNIVGSIVNLAAAGSLVKTELKAASGELNAEMSETSKAASGALEGSGSVSGVIELNPNIKSNKSFLNGLSKEARDFVYDPTTEKFAMAGKNVKNLKHYGLRRVIGASEGNVVGGRIKSGPNGEILTSQWSGTYGQNWTREIAKKFQEFMKNTTGREIRHSNSTSFNDGTN